MKYKVKFVVLRSSSDEVTFAVVTARVATDELRNDFAFQDALIAAITEWVKTTETGRAEWAGSCQDFNVGDLASCYDDPDLLKLLAERGIRNLKIEICSAVGQSQNWTYDQVLVDEIKLEELDEKAGK